MPQSTNKKRVLIAEDEKALARALSLKITNAGIDVVVAYTGEEVQAEIKKGGFDLVLMDLMMPQHDGFHVIEEMKNNGDKTPVIVMSNLSQDSDIERAHKLGIKNYFVKNDTKLSDIAAYVAKFLKK